MPESPPSAAAAGCPTARVAEPPRQAPRRRRRRAAAPAAAARETVDGARLIALNMALNGESREETERYLAENFELADRVQLIDEVYAAIEG